MMLRLLRDIRDKQDEHSDRFERLETRMDRVERRLDHMSDIVTYSLGRASEAKFLHEKQEGRIDEVVEQLETLLDRKGPPE